MWTWFSHLQFYLSYTFPKGLGPTFDLGEVLAPTSPDQKALSVTIFILLSLTRTSKSLLLLWSWGNTLVWSISFSPGHMAVSLLTGHFARKARPHSKGGTWRCCYSIRSISSVGWIRGNLGKHLFHCPWGTWLAGKGLTQASQLLRRQDWDQQNSVAWVLSTLVPLLHPCSLS